MLFVQSTAYIVIFFPNLLSHSAVSFDTLWNPRDDDVGNISYTVCDPVC